ncbi:MAG: hypothetical protein R3E97_05040 [Candidatus Eisenbacteria bacterium]
MEVDPDVPIRIVVFRAGEEPVRLDSDPCLLPNFPHRAFGALLVGLHLATGKLPQVGQVDMRRPVPEEDPGCTTRNGGGPKDHGHRDVNAAVRHVVLEPARKAGVRGGQVIWTSSKGSKET